MIPVTIHLTGESRLQAAFVSLGQAFSDFTPIFEKIGDEGEKIQKQRFEAEGPGWTRLTPRYAAQKARRYPGKTILRREDVLYLSFQKGNAGNIRRITRTEGEFGTSIFYAIYHQKTRPIIDMTSEHEARFINIACREMNERIRQLGFNVN